MNLKIFNFLLFLYFLSNTFVDFIPNNNNKDNLNKSINYNPNIIIKENTDEEFKNKYEKLEKIGKGGCGIVYKAKIKNSNEFRAIKFKSKEKIKNDLKILNNSTDIKEELNQFQNKLLNEIKLME